MNTLPTQNLPIDRIFSDPDFNCRGPIVPFDVIELVRSIEQNGLQQPVVVQPIGDDPKLPAGKYDYRLVMGHRRHKAFEILASKDSRFKTIPAIVRSDLTMIQARTMNLIENLERQDLTVMQEARAIQKFLVAGVTMNDVSKLIGKSTGWVGIRFTALKLPPEIQAEIDAGFISQEQIRDLYNIPSKEAMFEAVREIKERKLRGEKKPLKVSQKKKSLFEKKIRSQSEMFEMQDKIRDAVGNNLATRVLGWAAGLVTGMEFEHDLRDYAEVHGKPYHIPLETAS